MHIYLHTYIYIYMYIYIYIYKRRKRHFLNNCYISTLYQLSVEESSKQF